MSWQFIALPAWELNAQMIIGPHISLCSCDDECAVNHNYYVLTWPVSYVWHAICCHCTLPLKYGGSKAPARGPHGSWLAAAAKASSKCCGLGQSSDVMMPSAAALS